MSKSSRPSKTTLTPSASGTDQLTYKRSANAALLGLGVQIVLLLVVGLTSIFAASSALSLLTYYLFGGLLVWVSLWLLHNQHRLERTEALEAQALAASDQTAATIFDEAGDQLALARARLNNLYRYGLPAVSLILAVFLIALGAYQFFKLYRLIEFGTADGTDFSRLIERAFNDEGVAFSGALTLVLAVIAFFCFVVSRYMAGMTKSDAWSTLRGGAAYLMGNAAATLLVALGFLGLLTDSPKLLAVVPLIIAAFMVILGIEIVISFVLGIYRPRRRGEVPRIAFDSRLLGWLVRPESFGSIFSETINYQFGLEISKTWFYRLIGRAFAPIVALSVLLLVGISSIVVVDPAQMAVVTRGGDYSRIIGPGVTLKAPWPFGQVERYDVTRLQTLAVGSQKAYAENVRAILWTNDHAAEGLVAGNSETFLPTAPVRDGREGSQSRQADLAGARVIVNYRIGGSDDETTRANLEDYVNSAVDPDAVLEAIVEREVALYFATHDIDHLLIEGRAEVSDSELGLRPRIQAAIDTFPRADGGEGLGLEVVHVAMTSVHPPQEEEVAASFQQSLNARYERDVAVLQALQTETRLLTEVAGSVDAAREISRRIGMISDRENAINTDGASEDERAALEAEKVEVIRLIEASGGEAARQLLNARAERWTLVASERIAAERFAADLAAMQSAPEGFLETRTFYQTLANGMAAGSRAFILATTSEDDEPIQPTVRLDLEDRSTADLLGITGE